MIHIGLEGCFHQCLLYSETVAFRFHSVCKLVDLGPVRWIGWFVLRGVSSFTVCSAFTNGRLHELLPR